MKKTIRLFSILAILLGAVSCQDNGLDNGQVIDDGNLTITATIVKPDATRVTYDVDNETDHDVTPLWTVGDEIIGFDDDGHKFTFEVASVDGSGNASLNLNGYSKGNATKIYAIYAPGRTTGDFGGSASAYTLDVDLSTQNGADLNDNSPVLMCAMADATGSDITLSFSNQTAIIGVTKFKLPAAATITSVSVDGLITTGKFELNASGDLVLTPGTTPSTITATGNWATGDGNICATPLYFATLPTTAAKIALRASDDINDYGNIASIAATNIVAGNYYYMQKSLGAPVADVNGVKYGTLDDAWAAANRADTPVTVTLLSNCTATRLEINADSGSGEVTLDLNGHDINMSNQIRVTGRQLTIKDSSSDVLGEQGTITVDYTGGRAIYLESSEEPAATGFLYYQGGTITHNGIGYGTVYVHNNSSAFFSGGKLISKKYRVVSVVNDAVANFSGTIELEQQDGSYQVLYVTSTVNVSGGTFVRKGSGGYVVYVADESAVANITGGTFINTEGSSTNPAIYASKGTINFSKGYVQSTGINPVGADTGHAYVTGGCFNKAIRAGYAVDSESHEYINALNNDPITAAVYPFTVSLSSNKATVTQGSNEWHHATIESAFKCADQRAAGNGAAVITLQDNVEVENNLEISSGNSYSVTLDMNGHNLSSSLSPVLSLASDFALVDAGSCDFLTTGATALDVTGGTTTLSTGSLVAATNAITVNGGSLVVSGGHYYGGGEADIVKNTGSVSITGGWFRSEPMTALMATGYSLESGSETFNTRSYSYTVNGVVATVNGTNCTSWSSAVSAANNYAGGETTVTIQLQLDISGASAATFTNGTKPIILDLNGHILSTAEADFLTTTSTQRLTITDSGITKGKITSSAYNIISLTTSGSSAYITGCEIESTAGASTTSGNAVVKVDYSKESTRPIVVFDDGAKVYSANAHCVCYSKYGKMTFNDCEITSGKDVANGYHAIFINTGAIIDVNDGASIYSRHLSGDPSGAAIRSGTGNNASTITINGGWIWGGYSVNAGSGYSKRYFINAGLYNDDFSKYENMTEMNFPEGKALKAMSEVTHLHATTGETLSYGYQIATSSVIVNGAGYSTLAEAASAAVNDAGEKTTITLKLMEDISHNETLNLTHATKPVTLDLNGHILSTNVQNFLYPTSGTLTITDSAAEKGKLTTSSSQVVYAAGSSKVTISNCVIEGTMAAASAFSSQVLIMCGGATMQTTITGAKIYTDGYQTVIRMNNSGCKLTIENDAEITAGRGAEKGFYGIVNNSGKLTINGGSIWTKSSSTEDNAPSALHHSGANATTVINGGYFYSEKPASITQRTISGNNGSITMNGGYINIAPSSNIVKYGSGKSLQDCNVTHTHVTTGAVLTYEKKVDTISAQ